jgi:hypothetical protein
MSSQNGEAEREDPEVRDGLAEPGDREGQDDRIDRVSRGDRADRGARWNRGDQPYVDTQALSDLDTYVYEAVATLEYSGHPVTREDVMGATDLDDPTVSEILDVLTEHGVLTHRQTKAGDAFGLARRDWSATPETPSR